MEDLIIYNTIDSTNLEARRLLQAGPVSHGTALLANAQTAGKGQFDRSWHTETGDHLAMTLILQPRQVEVSQLPQVSMKISLGIVRVLQETDPRIQPKIKWPNDIYVLGKKCGGILIENTISGQMIQHIIAGIGININERKFPSALPNAVSLHLLTGETYDIIGVARRIRVAILQLLDHAEENWRMEYDALIFGLGEEYVFEKNGVDVKAVVEGVDDAGRIILRTSDGNRQSYYSHEIKWKW